MTSDLDPYSSPPPTRLVELVAHPEAPRWARDCAWVPGTGHCRNRPCSPHCLFRLQREAEAVRIARSRRERRRGQRAFIDRVARIVAAALGR